MTESLDKTLLRFTTTGSVDDGKSTLIGRLLHESNGIYEDQLAAITETSRRRGSDRPDLSLLLDGLAAEREQGITIDVAYRYFSTAGRKFIIADTPGHEQYTRNMVTGASTARLAIILIDAQKGMTTQSRRHGFINSLLRIPHLLVAVNKMDLVDYSAEVFAAIEQEYLQFSEKLEIHDLTFIPMSALNGDNVVVPSRNMPWYHGPTLLEFLERLHVASDRNLIDFRFPVQYVVRPDSTFRGFSGTIVSGTIRPGAEVMVLPSGRTSRVKSLVTFDGSLEEAFAGQAVVLTLEDEIDISRGDMIVRRNNVPEMADALDAMVCWMDDAPATGSHYVLKHTTREVKAFLTKTAYVIDVDTLHRQESHALRLNEIGRVSIKTSSPLLFDPFKLNPGTGSFILIDPLTHRTVAAGLIRGRARGLTEITGRPAARPAERSVFWDPTAGPRANWERITGHRAAVLWFTGLSGAGKSTIARRLHDLLADGKKHLVLLDGDDLRQGLCRDLGFSPGDRRENIRRAGETAKLFFHQGNIVLCTFISPFAADREFVRSLFPAGSFIEIHVACPVDECRRRDPKGLYAKADRGEIAEFTGVGSPYEAPRDPELIVATDHTPLEECAGRIVSLLQTRQILPTP
jgi:bifunctional enzyme CysN/CysC